MAKAFRIIVLLFVVPASYFFMFWVPFSFIPYGEQFWIPFVISAVFAVWVGRFVWNKLSGASPNMTTTIIVGGLIVGGVAFSAGFFGPIIFSPESNQGPLLGIFITGPIGFLLGLLAGYIYWRIKKRTLVTTGANKTESI